MAWISTVGWMSPSFGYTVPKLNKSAHVSVGRFWSIDMNHAVKEGSSPRHMLNSCNSRYSMDDGSHSFQERGVSK